MFKKVVLMSVAGLLMSAGIGSAAQNSTAICRNPAWSPSEQNACIDAFNRAKTDAERDRLRATYMAKAQNTRGNTPAPTTPSAPDAPSRTAPQ